MSAGTSKPPRMTAENPPPEQTPTPPEPETPEPAAEAAAPPAPSSDNDVIAALMAQNQQLIDMLKAQAAAPPQVVVQQAAPTGRVTSRVEGYDVVPPPATAAADQYGLQPDGSVLVHIVHDGFTGVRETPWYVGENLQVWPGTPEWALIHDAAGRCLIVDDDAQWDRYKQVYYLAGPWTGRGYTDRVQFDMPEVYSEADNRGTGQEFTGWTERERRELDRANAERQLH